MDVQYSDRSGPTSLAGSTNMALAPITPETFFRDYWEQQPLHIDRSDNVYFKSLINTDALETLLSTQDLYFPEVQLSRAEAAIPVQEYVDEDNRVLPYRLIEFYREGGTLVLSRAHRKIATLARFVREIQRDLQMRCQTNVYLSPAGCQGLNAHYDTHDVLVLQVEGQKTFHFYSRGVELPFNDERFDASLTDNGTLEQSITLNPGDTLYIPRGFRHDALAEGDRPSLHITLGLFPVIMRDLLQSLVQVAAENNPAMRRSVLIDSGQPVARDELQVLFQNLVTDENLIEARSRLKDKYALSDMEFCTDLLDQPQRPEAIESGQTLEVVTSRVVGLERYGERLKLRTFGQVLEFVEPFSTAVEWLLDTPRFQPEDLPGLDSTQSIALSRRLFDENLLQRS